MKENKRAILQWKATGRYLEYSLTMREKPESLQTQDSSIRMGSNEPYYAYDSVTSTPVNSEAKHKSWLEKIGKRCSEISVRQQVICSWRHCWSIRSLAHVELSTICWITMDEDWKKCTLPQISDMKHGLYMPSINGLTQ